MCLLLRRLQGDGYRSNEGSAVTRSALGLSERPVIWLGESLFSRHHGHGVTSTTGPLSLMAPMQFFSISWSGLTRKKEYAERVPRFPAEPSCRGLTFFMLPLLRAEVSRCESANCTIVKGLVQRSKQLVEVTERSDVVRQCACAKRGVGSRENLVYSLPV